MTLTFEMTSPGDDKFWRGLSAAKTMIARKEFERAMAALNDLNTYATKNGFNGGVVVDEPIARCLIGLRREHEAISLLEPYLRRHGDVLAFKRLIKLFGDRGTTAAKAGDVSTALVELNKALSLTHLFALIHQLRPAGKVWRGNEASVAVNRLFDEILSKRGSIYGWNYEHDGVPSRCIMCNRDLRILHALTFPTSA